MKKNDWLDMRRDAMSNRRDHTGEMHLPVYHLFAHADNVSYGDVQRLKKEAESENARVEITENGFIRILFDEPDFDSIAVDAAHYAIKLIQDAIGEDSGDFAAAALDEDWDYLVDILKRYAKANYNFLIEG